MTGYKIKKGFTLVEALTVLFIFSLISITFYQVISVGTRYIQDAKNRLGAIAVAKEKMEIVRNLKYDSIGTTGAGTGNISENEDVLENGKKFHVNTVIGYADDIFDKTYATGDLIPGDYKNVIITVSWDNSGMGNSKVKVESRFVPPGLEVLSPGDGVLSINVFSDQPGGTGISGSSVHIVNSDTHLDTTQQTDASGNVILIGPNVEDSIQKYIITVTKTGYETVSTMPPYPTTSYNPTFVHASVAQGAVNVANIVQNELANLKISTLDYKNQPVSNINFHLVGGKQMGTEAVAPNKPIYNLEEDSNTDSSGEKNFNDISPGQYSFNLDSSVAGYEIIGTDPAILPDLVDGNAIYSFPLHSDPSLDFKVKLADKNATSLLVSVLKNSDGTPIPGATVKLVNASGYDVSQSTLINGRAFFPTTENLFENGVYDLSVSAEGFIDSSSQVTINNGELKMETIRLVVAP